MMKPEVRIPALVVLGRLSIDIVSGFISSAFNGTDIDKAYVDKYEKAYTAYLCDDAYATVLNIVKNNTELVDKARKLFVDLKEAGYISSEYDLASILNSGELAFKSSDADVLPEDTEEAVPTVVLDADDKYVLAGHCTAVMNAYKLLYANVFAPKAPLGAYGLCPGHATYTKGAIYAYSEEKGRDAYRSPDIGGMTSIRTLYKALGFDALTESSKWSAIELGAENSTIYSVRYMGRFANKVVDAKKGKEANSKEYWKQLGEWVEKKLLSVYEAYITQGMDEAWLAVSRASRNLATAFVIEECDIRVSNLLLVKVCAPSLTIKTGESAMLALEQLMLASGQQNLAVRALEPSSNTTGLTVYTIAMALDDVLEADAPSFAYQAWDDALSAGKPLSEVLGTHNVIFGRHADGTQRCFNLANQNEKAHNMAVIAGGGSGKGLTTLVTVGAAAARREPLFYLDCKPEMSSILRRYMAGRGQEGRVYAYDGQAIQLQLATQIPGSNPDLYKPFELPYGITLSDAVKNGLAMAKTIALLLATMKYLSVESPEDQKDRWATVGYAGVGGLAVFDELQLLNSLAWVPMMEAIMKLPNAKDKDLDYANYVKKLKSFVTDSEENIRGAANALLRFTPISTLSLFQDFKFATNEKPIFQGLFRLQNLVGRVGDSGNANTRRVANPRLYDALAQRKWAVAPSAASEVNLATLSNPIKPYLVFGTPDDVKGYQTTAAWNALPEDYRDTLDTSKLDFIGLLTHPDYNIDLGASLACGYDMAQHMLNMSGFGGTVEDYITSFQPEAMLGYMTLYKDAFKNYAAIKAGSIQYTNPPLAGTGDIPIPYAVGGGATVEGDYANKLDAETPVSVTEPEYDNLDDGIIEDVGQLDAPFKDDYDGDPDGTNIIDAPLGSEGKTDSDTPFGASTPTTSDTLFTPNKAEQPDTPAQPQQAQDFGQQYQRQTINPQLAMPFPQFQSLFQRQSPQIQQQTIQYQQIFGTPCIYSDATNVFYSQDADGFLIPVSGQYAVPPNMRPRVYQNETRTDANIVDTTAPHFIGFTPNGATTIDEQSGYTHGRPIQGPEVMYKGKVKPITPNMSIKKLESAMAQRWAIMLRAGAKVVGDSGLVARVKITEYELYINGVAINAADEILGEAGLRVTEVVDFAEMFKYYKGLKQLDLDSVARIPFSAAYSHQAIAFTQSKSLQVITFTDSKGNVTEYTRQAAANKLQVPEDKLTSHFNTWTALASQVNKGQSSSFSKPGTRLVMADYTKRLAVGAFGPGSTWSKKRRALGALGMLACAAGTVITGGVQVARASQVKHR